MAERRIHPQPAEDAIIEHLLHPRLQVPTINILHISQITQNQLHICSVPTCPSTREAGKCLIIFNLTDTTTVPRLGLHADLADLLEQPKEKCSRRSRRLEN